MDSKTKSKENGLGENWSVSGETNSYHKKQITLVEKKRKKENNLTNTDYERSKTRN